MVYASKKIDVVHRGIHKEARLVLTDTDSTGCINVEIKGAGLGIVIPTSYDDLNRLLTVCLEKVIREQNKA